MPVESGNTFIRKIAGSLRRKKTEKTVLNKEGSSKQTQENKPEYIKFVKSAEPCVNELLIESFIKQLSFTILENKPNEKNISKYKGLGFLIFVTSVFFGFDREIKIKLIDPQNHIMELEFDVTGLQFNQSSIINSDIIDGFVAGENSIQQLYFPPKTQGSSLEATNSSDRVEPGSNDWATFRIECNKAIHYILGLSQQHIKDMIPEELNKLENVEVKLDEWVEVILAKQNTLYQAVLKSMEYTRYNLTLKASNPITRENMKSTIGTLYRQSQFFECESGKTIPVVNRVELEGFNNNNPVSNPVYRLF
ncbi:MAG: hypothetical protein V4471_07745 [Pseudomonadota bacterium]